MAVDEPMRYETDRPVDLLVANAWSLLVIVAVGTIDAWPPRVLLGLPFLLLFPGYTLVAALFPEGARSAGVEGKRGLDGVERLALSMGLSLAVVPLIGFVLNFTPLGVRLGPIVLFVALWTFAMSLAAAARRRRVPPVARFRVAFEVSAPKWREYTLLDKALSVALALAVVSAGSALAYVALKPRSEERFTEFYILGAEGKAADYPTTLAPNANGTLRVGVVNHEGERVEYAVRIVFTPGDFRTNESGARVFAPNATTQEVATLPVPLDDEAAWEENVTFAAPSEPGTYRLGLDLHRPGQGDPYRSLHLWVTVRL